MHINRRTALTTAAMGGLTLVAGLSAAQAAERHPKIRQAIHALEQAKDDLQHADHDFGGHRVEAIQSIDRAIEQLRTALKFDRR